MAYALTDASVKKPPAPAAGNRLYRDAAMPGFALRVTAGGHRALVLDYRTKAGRKRRLTIGGWPNWAVGAARIEARRLRRLVDAGGDPQGELEDAREAPELVERFRAEHLPRRHAGTVTDYESMIDRHIRPHFANVKVDAVTHHQRITAAGHSYRANRVTAVVSKLFSLAIKWNMRTDGVNPAKGIEKNVDTTATGT
jgi:Arm domain-containing DNA-binding protein/integrase-like protein